MARHGFRPAFGHVVERIHSGGSTMQVLAWAYRKGFQPAAPAPDRAGPRSRPPLPGPVRPANGARTCSPGPARPGSAAHRRVGRGHRGLPAHGHQRPGRGAPGGLPGFQPPPSGPAPNMLTIYRKELCRRL